MVAILPAVLVLYIRRNVAESPGWTPPGPSASAGGRPAVGGPRSGSGIGRYIYAIALMTAAASFSHGTQDLYPTFLRVQHGFSVHEVAGIAIVYNIGAILGCLCGGSLSQKIGRRRAMVVAAGVAVVLMPFWALSSSQIALAVTAFFMQFLVQCMFGTMPAHLNEISPPEARATFPGFTYQFGNFLAAGNATLQVVLAGKLHGDYGFGMAIVAGCGAIAFAVLAALGPEGREVRMAAPHPSPSQF